MTHHQPQAKAKTAPPLKLFLPAHKKHPLLISMQRGTVIYSKSLAEFATSVANKVKYILRQGVYLTQNTSQAVSLAPQRCAERNRRRRLLARSCKSCAPMAHKECARRTAKNLA